MTVLFEEIDEFIDSLIKPILEKILFNKDPGE
jgi:hypothetical protein